MQDHLPTSNSIGARPPRNPSSRKPPATNVGRNRLANTANHHHHHNNNNDDRSIGTPCSSLLLRTNNSHRDDMSDLSGSYHHAAAVLPTGDDAGPWRHAPRTRLPAHPQPHGDHDESSFHNRRGGNIMNHNHNNNHNNKNSHHNHLCRVLLEDDPSEPGGPGNTIIEVEALHLPRQPLLLPHHAPHPTDDPAARIPAILLLMDPQRKKYEIMQLWMDPNIDTIREIIQAISRNIGDWKQDYDGLFQVRNNHFSQLIHVLSAGRYDILPHEVWVAKPWSMSAKVTVGYASTLLNHLKRIGVLEYKRAMDYKSSTVVWNNNNNTTQYHRRKPPQSNNSTTATNDNDTVLVLSSKAQRRIYVPEGILKHHHAAQFLCFVPTFEPTTTTQMDVFDLADASSSVASALSDSLAEDDPAPGLASVDAPQHSKRDSDDQSETESTYSTTGTNSPKPKNRLQHCVTTTHNHNNTTRVAAAAPETVVGPSTSSSSCGDNASAAGSRASAYVIRHRTSRMTPTPPTPAVETSFDQQTRGGLARWLRALNCTKSIGASSISSTDPEPLLLSDEYPPKSRLQKTLIDSSDVASQSSKAPLLFSTRCDWVSDE